MIVGCPKCGLRYDDARSWTICPHNPLTMAATATLCRRCDLFVGFTNIGTASDDPDHCMICGRDRATILADA